MTRANPFTPAIQKIANFLRVHSLLVRTSAMIVFFLIPLIGLGLTLANQFQEQKTVAESGLGASLRGVAQIQREILRLNLLIAEDVHGEPIALQRALVQSRINIFRADVLSRGVPENLERKSASIIAQWESLTGLLDSWEANPKGGEARSTLDNALTELELLTNELVSEYSTFRLQQTADYAQANQRALTILGAVALNFFVFIALLGHNIYRAMLARQEAQAALQLATDNLADIVDERTRELQEANENLQVQYLRQAAMADIELSINQAQELEAILERIVQVTTELLPASGGASIILWDSAEQRFQLSTSTVPEQPPHITASRLRVEGGASRWVIDNRKPIVVPDVRDDPFGANPFLNEYELQAYLGVPLLAGEEVLGLMYALDMHTRAYQTEDIEFMQAMAHRVATVIVKVRLFEELQLAKVEAEAASSAKSDFLSRISHELRTPMNSILGFAQLLAMSRKDPITPTQRVRIDNILKSGKHLLDLINEVLEISRIEAGRVDLSPEPVDLSHLIEQVVALTDPLAGERGIHLHWEKEAGEPVYLLADIQRLKQVLINLVSNAIKYSHTGGDVWLHWTSRPDGYWRIRVRDAGIGIPAELQDRLFQPFERLGIDKSGVEGTGLGLALSKRLVELMDGQIGFESSPGVGSTFWVDMPSAAPLPNDKTAADFHDFSSVPAIDYSHLILYIEDNLTNYELVHQLLLEQTSVKLISALQGSVGLDLARQHKPDLILLDLHLPDIEGEQVLTHLRADEATSAIPVIVISADATPIQIEHLMTIGANAYHTKPLNLPEFLATVQTLLVGD